MGQLALALFVILFATADKIVDGQMLGHLGHDARVQVALFAAFLFGVITSYKKAA